MRCLTISNQVGRDIANPSLKWVYELLSALAGVEIQQIKFQSGESFEKYVNSNINNIKECIFFVDYELTYQAKTGLQIIEDLVIEKHSILVTRSIDSKDL